MADHGRIEGERVFCYQCNNEWDRAHGGLTCPRCAGEFVEILPPGTRPPIDHDDDEHDDDDLFHRREPSLSPSPPRQQPSPPFGPFHDHNPWADVPDPDEGDITMFEFNTENGGRGTWTFSTRTIRTGGPGPPNVMNDPHLAELAHNFDEMLTNIVGRQGHGFPPPPFGPFTPFGFPGPRPPGLGGYAATGTAWPRDPHAPLQPGNMQDLFSAIFQSIQPLNHDLQGPERDQDHPPNPFDFLSAVFNPGNARQGDMVFSQEAFDRIMSQLMEQHQGSTAPPPASPEAIRSLPTKKVEESMMGSDGLAECSICMENVEVGDDVTVLPCKHWFHGDCVKAWLNEHDTCPHCRKPTTNPEDREQQPGSSTQRPSQRSSSVSSPRAPPPEGGGGRWNRDPIPESPSGLREARQRYYGSRRDPDLDRPRSHQHPSNHTGRQDSSRSGNGSGGSGGSGGNGGGVTGWIRNHMPFSS